MSTTAAIPAGTTLVEYLTARNDKDGNRRRLFVARDCDGVMLACAREKHDWTAAAAWVQPAFDADRSVITWHYANVTVAEYRATAAAGRALVRRPAPAVTGVR